MSDIKIRDFQEAAPDWRVVSDGACAFFRTSSLNQAAAFVAAIAQVPNLNEHRYGVDIRPVGVTVRLVTLRDDYMGMTDRDVELALAISAIAMEQGCASDPSRVQSMILVPGAPNIKEVTPFWQAALGYVPRPDSVEEDMIDADDRLPAFWFETMDEPRPGGLGAIHLAVWLPSEEVARARVDAALAAGGTMVRDEYAPSWWTLADKYGNEIDLATVAYRDEPPPGWEPPTAEA